jgi:hypothetical protein
MALYPLHKQVHFDQLVLKDEINSSVEEGKQSLIGYQMHLNPQN